MVYLLKPRCQLAGKMEPYTSYTVGAKRRKLSYLVFYIMATSSGKANGENIVPWHGNTVNEQSLFEEHQFTMPFSAIEWKSDSQYYASTLHTVPSLVYGSRHSDQWRSLGIVRAGRFIGSQHIFLQRLPNLKRWVYRSRLLEAHETRVRERAGLVLSLSKGCLPNSYLIF